MQLDRSCVIVNQPLLLSQFGFSRTQITLKTSFSFFFVSSYVGNVLLTACIELHERNALMFHILSFKSLFLSCENILGWICFSRDLV